jgi:hypothetical protein
MTANPLFWFDHWEFSLHSLWEYVIVNWSSYNDALIRCGEVILNFDVIDFWKNELEMMNDGKRDGASDFYPH